VTEGLECLSGNTCWAKGEVIKPSVMIPRVPSAPVNNFVVSQPADDFRDRRRVLITSPDGRTTV